MKQASRARVKVHKTTPRAHWNKGGTAKKGSAAHRKKISEGLKRFHKTGGTHHTEKLHMRRTGPKGISLAKARKRTHRNAGRSPGFDRSMHPTSQKGRPGYRRK